VPGKCAAYDSTNPVHPQTVAEVTESPMPTTTADPGETVGGVAMVGVAAGVVVGALFGAGTLRTPAAGVRLVAPRIARTARVHSRALAASHPRLGRQLS